MESIAKLKNLAISPRKMKLIVNTIKNKNVVKALTILKYQNKKGSLPLKKLLISAISNWQQKNKNKNEESGLYIKKIQVNPGRILKRIKAAPQGRVHKIRKRYNHITIILDGISKLKKK